MKHPNPTKYEFYYLFICTVIVVHVITKKSICVSHFLFILSHLRTGVYKQRLIWGNVSRYWLGNRVRTDFSYSSSSIGGSFQFSISIGWPDRLKFIILYNRESRNHMFPKSNFCFKDEKRRNVSNILVRRKLRVWKNIRHEIQILMHDFTIIFCHGNWERWRIKSRIPNNDHGTR